MRHRARVDANHPEIVKALRQIGCSVQSLANVGKGCPDLLVGRAGRNILLEVKDGSKVKSRRGLTADEAIWAMNWAGQVAIVESVAEAIAVVQR